jgi:tRNA-guanine family transglycosylase
MKIETPFFWLGQTIKGVPRPWKHFKVDGLMVNAYEILQNPLINKLVRNENIHSFLKYDGLVVMDSGGFQFIKRKMLDVDPREILNLYVQSKPNYGVILDHPIGPNLTKKDVRRRQLITLRNTKLMLKLHTHHNPRLIPVVHGYDSNSTVWFIKKLQGLGDFDFVGVGSLVPFIYNMKGVFDTERAIEIISCVRKMLPQNKIHVFGVGSTFTMHLMFYAGADSVDSSAWRMKAAFGAIQLPGIGDRHVSNRKRHKKYPTLSKEEKRMLDKCKCPACRNYSIEGLRNSFKLRAIHNAWVYQKECERARRLIKSGEYEAYVRAMIGRTRFSKFLDIIDKLEASDMKESKY